MIRTRNRALGTGLPLLALLLLLYQNCGSKVGFEVDLPSEESFLGASNIVINNGAEYTNNSSVKVQVTSPFAETMYLTNDPTCATGGEWEPIRYENSWALAQSNSQATVYAKFKNKTGVELPCISGSIVHDDHSPEVSIIRAPRAFSQHSTESLDLQGYDSLSGLDHFECSLNGDAFKTCSSTVVVNGLADGNQTFRARAVDRAGNRSEISERYWVVDRVKPTLKLVNKPDSPSSSYVATFVMEASDNAGGSGLHAIHCQVDNLPLDENCSLSETLVSLSEGQHFFQAVAVDKAGNQSTPVQHTWTVATVPSGDFKVIGVTGGADSTIDNLLGTTLTPTVHWSPSAGAVEYEVSILNSASATVCGPVATNSTSYAFPSTCQLKDGAAYKVKASAFNSAGIVRNASLYSFTVDVTPPQINITGPIVGDDSQVAKFKFTISDASGVQDAVCTKSYSGSDQSVNCKGLSEYTYTNLANGPHVFSISAIDKAGNQGTSAPINWSVKLVVCDPFNQVEGGCKKGLRADLYYLTGTQLNSPFTKVNEYINKGTKANAIIYMSQLFVPTRDFSTGFSTNDKTVIVDDNGNKLVEYFALDFETIIKLGPNDSPGQYQFGILSDDGSIMEIKDTPSSPYRSLISNDNDHSTRLGCATDGVNLTSSSRIPVRLKYFQGPRTRIALTLVWRKIDPTDPNAKKDKDCGYAHNTYYFGSNTLQPDLNNSGFGEMKKRGWKVLAPENFILPEEVK